MRNGIALPITEHSLFLAEEIIGLHIGKEEEAGGVYFSTSNRIAPEKALLVELILLFNKREAYIAEVKDYHYFEDGGIPADSEEYSPKEFIAKSEKHWFKIDSLRKVGDDELKEFEMRNQVVQQKYGSVSGYIKESKRFQVFYFRAI